MDPPVTSWTPTEGWLFEQLLRRSLFVGDRPVSLSSNVAVDLPTATTLTLRPQPLGGHAWRADWVVHLDRGDGVAGWLSVETPEVRVAGGEAPLALHLRRRKRVVAHEPLRGAPPVPLADVAFAKNTRQSTAQAVEGAEIGPWMLPTAAEIAPWWEIDLGSCLFVESLRLTAALAGANVVVEAYAYPTPAGEVPAASWRSRQKLTEDVVVELSTVARYLRVSLESPVPVVLALRSVEVFAAELFGETLLGTWQRAFTLFRDRPLFASAGTATSAGRVSALVTSSGPPRSRAPVFSSWSSYAEIWEQALQLARGLAARIEATAERTLMAICAQNQPAWVVADLAAIQLGWVVVPLAPDDSDDRLAGIVRRAGVSVVVCDDVRRWESLTERCSSVRLVGTVEALSKAPHREPPSERPDSDALYTLLFTSGSTGAPKGAMRSYAAFNAMLASYGVVQPAVHLSFQPLSHLSERMLLPTVMIHGGQIAFARGGAQLFEDLRALRPTFLFSVPRLYDVLYARFLRRLGEVGDDGEDAVLGEIRLVFGDRLQSVSVGSAPCSPTVLRFLRRCFSDIWVTEGYGSTECGTITVDGRVPPDVDVRLEAVPSLGYDPDGDPSRGAILVRTAHLAAGYFGDDEATRASFDRDGYFRTGDLGERLADGSVHVIGRLQHAVKLAQGEFVAPDRIEAVLRACALVDQIYVHADAHGAAVSAVVFPDPPGTTSVALLAALREHAQRAGLAAYETPARVVVITEPMTQQNGLLTASGKLDRRAARDRFAALVARSSGSPAAHDGSRLAHMLAIASEVTGERVDPDAPLGAALGDSLAIAEVIRALGSELDTPVSLSDWFASSTLRALAQRLTHPSLSEARRGHHDDLDIDPVIDPALSPARHPLERVLLTGATGFLGAHLLESILRQTPWEVVCLVRGDAQTSQRLVSARRRLVASLAERGVGLIDERVEVIVGDLGRARLGLDAASWSRLAGGVDAVFHAGARVSWLAPYAKLREPNVLGTASLVELAARGRQKSFFFVSTISCAPSDGDEETSLSLAQAEAGSAYALSKWIAERLVRRAGARGLPVSVFRPAMIAGHSRRGDHHRGDYIQRYLSACGALGLYLDTRDKLDMTPVDYVADAIIGLARQGADGRTHHLANISGSLTYGALGRALVAAGVACEPADYPRFRAALFDGPANALRALAAYFPAEGFALGMGPWPDGHTRRALAELGVVCPVIDDATVARYVASLRSRGVPA